MTEIGVGFKRCPKKGKRGRKRGQIHFLTGTGWRLRPVFSFLGTLESQSANTVGQVDRITVDIA